MPGGEPIHEASSSACPNSSGNTVDGLACSRANAFCAAIKALFALIALLFALIYESSSPFRLVYATESAVLLSLHVG